MKYYGIPMTPLVSGLIPGFLMERFFPTPLENVETPVDFLLQPRTPTIMGLAFLFSLRSLWPAFRQLIDALCLRARNGRARIVG